MPIAVVHTTALNSTSGTIPATAPGNCLVVCVMSENSAQASVSGVTLGGSAGNFAQLAAGDGNNGFSQYEDAIIWADPGCAGGQTAVAISGTNLGIAFGGVVVYEISGLRSSLVLDKSSTGGAGSGTAWSSGTTPATTQASEIWIGCGIAGTAITAPGSPWTDSGAGFTYAAAGYQIVSVTGTATYNGTQSTTSPWAAAVVTLLASTGGGSLAADMPQIRPGPTWISLYKPQMPRPRPQVPQPSQVFVPPPPPNQPSPLADVPQISPGRTWLALYKPWMPKRPQVPPGDRAATAPAACGSTIASPGLLPGNLLSVADSDFETWTGDWTAGSNTITGQSAETAFCGCDSLVMVAIAGGTVSATSPRLPAAALGSYIASGYLFSASGATGYISYNFYNSGLTLISSVPAAAVTLLAGAWTPVTAAQAAPAGTAWITLTYTVTGLAAGQTAFLDLAYAARAPAQVLIAWPTQPTSSTPLFADVTPWVRADKGIKITRGRADEVSEVQASKLTMTLDNTTGWFTVGNPGSPWYPGVLIGRRAQVSEADQNGAWHTRFDGTLTDLPVTWTGGNAAEALTPAAASGVLAKLGRAPGLRTMLEQEILQDTPVCFYALSDASGSAVASDSSGNGAAPLTVKTYGTGGKLAFASGGAIVEAVNLAGSSPLTSVLCTPVVASPGGPLNQQNQQLEGYLPSPVTAAAGFTFEIWTTGITFAANADNATWYAIALGNPQSGAMIGVCLTGGYGSPSVVPALTLVYTPSIYSAAPALTEFSWAGPPSGPDAGTFGFPVFQPGMYAVTVSGTTATLWYNYLNTMQVIGAITIPAAFEATYLTVGGPLGGRLGWQGSLNCAAVFGSVLPSSRLATHFDAGWAAFNGGYIYQLIGNVTRYAGLPSWQLDLPPAGVSLAGTYSLSGQGPLAALQTYEKTDGGVLYENAAGQLAYQDRSARYGAQASTAPVLQLAAGQYEPDLLPSITDQFLINDCTAGTTIISAAGTGTTTSVTAWVRAASAASVADYGTYPSGTPQSPQTGPYYTYWIDQYGVAHGLSLDVVGDAANWTVGTYSQPGPRSPVVTVDLLTQPGLRSAVLSAEIGTMLQLEGLPAQYPGGVRPAFMLIEGVTDTLKWDGSGAEWTVVFNTSPSAQSGAWLAGDPAMGILDLTAVTGRGTDGSGPPTGAAAVYAFPSAVQAGPPYAVPAFSTTMNLTGNVGANDMRGITSNLQQALTPPVACASQQSLAQVISSSFTWTAIEWDTLGFDTGLGFQLGSLGSSSSSYYTIPVGGTWLLMATVSWLAASGATLNASIASGAGPFTFLAQQTVTGNTAGPTAQQVSVKASLAAGTQVLMLAGTSVTLTLDNATGGCQFSAVFLGET